MLTARRESRFKAVFVAVILVIVALVVMLPQNLARAQAPVGEWVAEFYNGTDLEGPVVNTDIIPGFFLNYEIPPSEHPSGTNSQINWSARFSSTVTFPDSGNVKFLMRADDGARMYINGALAFDASGGTNLSYAARVLPVPAGTYVISVEYFEYSGENYVELLWESTTDLPGEMDENFIIPGATNDGSGGGGATPSEDASVLPAVVPVNQWAVQYYDTSDFSTPVVNTSVVPGPFLTYEIPPSNHPSGTTSQTDWGARFSTVATFPVAGNYKFILRADDGARMYINGALAFDASGGTNQTFASKVLPLPAGSFTILVEYFEYDGENYIELFWEPTTDLPGELDENFVPPGATTPQSTSDTVVSGPVSADDAPGTGTSGTPAANGILVDDTAAPGFSWSGSQDWRIARGGLLNNQYLYTDNSQFSFRIWGRWNVALPEAGDYEVWVYIPNHPGATSNARYRVFHSGVLSGVIQVDQAANLGQWVKLGTFAFTLSDTQYVYLNDLTFETSGARDVVFDAVQFVYVGE